MLGGQVPAAWHEGGQVPGAPREMREKVLLAELGILKSKESPQTVVPKILIAFVAPSQRHMLRNHKSPSENHKNQEFQCEECEYKCSKRDTLRMHWHMHL